MSTPMGRDEVLAVLDEWGELHKARSAVAALYVKNAQLEAQLQERISELFAMELERDALRLALERIAAYNDTGAWKQQRQHDSYTHFDEPHSVQIAHEALTGTDPSDAEGGG